jgi:hypothetical protein
VYAYDRGNDRNKWNSLLEDDPNIKKTHLTARIVSVVTSAIQSLVIYVVATYIPTY